MMEMIGIAGSLACELVWALASVLMILTNGKTQTSEFSKKHLTY
jgi:hypothetical protein